MKPILLDIPFPITTYRLSIRPPQPGDGPELNAAVTESLGELRPWLPWAKTTPSLEDSEESARRAYAAWILRDDLRLSIFSRDRGHLVASSGLHRINWDNRRFEIGYWCRTKDSTRGYITEAVTAITQFAFACLDAKRVEIRCDVNNERSRRIPERLGFTFEATLKAHDRSPATDELHDTLLFVRFDAAGLPDVGAHW